MAHHKQQTTHNKQQTTHNMQHTTNNKQQTAENKLTTQIMMNIYRTCSNITTTNNVSCHDAKPQI